MPNADFYAIIKHLAEEVNVKSVYLNDGCVYSEPLLSERYKEKQKQFEEIYGKDGV